MDVQKNVEDLQTLDWKKPASYRQALNNPLVGGALVLGLLLFALMILGLQRCSSSATSFAAQPPQRVYYYDLTTRELFGDLESRVPPFDRPSGHKAVQAAVYACGPCTPETQKIAYLSALPEDAAAELRAMPPSTSIEQQEEMSERLGSARLFAKPEPDPNRPIDFYRPDEAPGQAILDAAGSICADRPPVPCYPPPTP